MNPEGKIAHFSEFEEGGHFPAMEAPDLLVGDIREFFRGAVPRTQGKDRRI